MFMTIMKAMRKHLLRPAVRIAVLSLALFILMVRTSPDSVGPLGITAFFLLLYFWCYSLLKPLLRFIKKGISSLPFDDTDFFPVALVAGLPSLLLALLSTGQLTARDAIIILIVFVVVIFYWSRRR